MRCIVRIVDKKIDDDDLFLRKTAEQKIVRKSENRCLCSETDHRIYSRILSSRGITQQNIEQPVEYAAEYRAAAEYAAEY